MVGYGEFSGSPVVRALSLPGPRVRSLVWQLRYRKPRGLSPSTGFPFLPQIPRNDGKDALK